MALPAPSTRSSTGGVRFVVDHEHADNPSQAFLIPRDVLASACKDYTKERLTPSLLSRRLSNDLPPDSRSGESRAHSHTIVSQTVLQHGEEPAGDGPSRPIRTLILSVLAKQD